MADAPAPLRVLFLTRSLGFGGAERQLVELAREMHRGGHVVTVVEFYGPGPLAAELVEAGIRVRGLAKKGRWDITGFARSLAQVVREERPDILHSYLVEPNIAAAALKARFPRLRVVWGIRASNMDFARYGMVSRASFMTSVALSRLPDLIIANSQAGARYHEDRGYPGRRITVIPNGIETARFRPDAASRQAERAALAIEGATKLVGAMGRLDVMKDHPTFLRAAGIIARARADVRFVIIGSGPEGYRGELVELAASLGVADRIHWMPSRTDAEQALASLDVLVSASAFGEGFPNVVGEAMATGVPCVVTDVGDSAVVVGDAGVVVPPGNPEALARGVLQLLPRLSPALSTACRARVLTNFGVPQLAERTVAVLRPLLAC